MPTIRLALILGSALLVACSDNTAPSAETKPEEPSLAAQQTKHITLQQPFAFDAQSPCTGELIHFTGLDVEQITVVGPPELLEQGIQLHIEQKGSLTGTGTAASGRTYSLNDVFHFGFNSPSVAATQASVTYVETLRAVSPEPGQSFMLRFAFHTTVLPSGEVKTTFDTATGKCIGR
jgi:hypothetical protein